MSGVVRDAMRADLIRRPRTVLEVLADVARVAGAVSVVVAGVAWGWTDAAVLLLATGGTMVPRILGVRGGLDLAACLTVLVAAWSGVIDLYSTIAWWDVAVHLVCTGVLAATTHLLLARLGIVPEPRAPGVPAASPIVLATAIGLAISAVWEVMEWLGHNLVDAEIFVAYDDTIGDMAMGGIGSLVAGILLATVRLRKRDAGRVSTPVASPVR